ncbi:hypothetical protein GC177_02220 [bacterium]|nr:hypothetical protein [bacterium]
MHGYESGRAPGAEIWLGSGTLQVHDGEYLTTPGLYNRTVGELFGQWQHTVVKRGIVESGVKISADKVDIKTFLPSKDGYWDRTILKADKTDVIVKNAPYGIENAEIISLEGSVLLGFNRTGESPPIQVGGHSNLFAADELRINGSLHDSTIKYPVVEMEKTQDDRIDRVEIRGDIVNCKIFDSFVLDTNRIINSEVRVDTSVTVRNDPTFYSRNEQGDIIQVVKDDPGNTVAIINSDIDIIETEVNNAQAGDTQFIEVLRGNIVSSNIIAPDADLCMADIHEYEADPAALTEPLGDILNPGSKPRTIKVMMIEANNLHGRHSVETFGPVMLSGTAKGDGKSPLMMLLGGDLGVAGVAPLLAPRNADPAIAQPNYSMAYVQVELKDVTPSMEIESAGSIYGSYIGPEGRDNPAWIDISLTSGNVESSTIETYGNLSLPQGSILNCRTDGNKEKIMAADVTALSLSNSEVHVLRSAEIGTIATQPAAGAPAQPLPDAMDKSIIKQHEGRDYFLAHQPPQPPQQAGVAPRQAEGIRVHGNALQSVIHTPDMDVTVDGAFSVQGNWEYFGKNRKGEFTGTSGLYAPIAAQSLEVGGRLDGIASPLQAGGELANCGAEIRHLKAQGAKGLVITGLESLELRGAGASLEAADITYADPAAATGLATFTVEGPISDVSLQPSANVVTKPSVNATGPISHSTLDCHDVTATHLVQSRITANAVESTGLVIDSVIDAQTIHAVDAANSTLQSATTTHIDNVTTDSVITAGEFRARHMHGGQLQVTGAVELTGADAPALDQYAAHGASLPDYQAHLTQVRGTLAPEAATIDTIHAASLTLPPALTRLTANDIQITTGNLDAQGLTLTGHTPQDMNEPRLEAPFIHLAAIHDIPVVKVGGTLRAGDVTGIRTLNARGNVELTGNLTGSALQPGQTSQLVGTDITAAGIQRIDKIWARQNLHANELSDFTWLVAHDAEITGAMTNKPDEKNYVFAQKLNAPLADLKNAMILLDGEGQQNHIGSVSGSTVIHAPYIRNWLEGFRPGYGQSASTVLTKYFVDESNRPNPTPFYNFCHALGVDNPAQILEKLDITERGLSSVNFMDVLRARASLFFDTAEPVLPIECFEGTLDPNAQIGAFDQAGLVTIDHADHLDLPTGETIQSHLIGHHLSVDDLANSCINAHILDGVFEPREGGVLVEPLSYMAIGAAGELLDDTTKMAAFRDSDQHHGMTGIVAISKDANNPYHFPDNHLIDQAQDADMDYLREASVLPAGALDQYDLVMLSMYERLEKNVGEEPHIIGG